MKTTDKKLAFIQLRANNMSYDKIAQQLHISKSTCTAWAEELEAEVAGLEEEQLQELYTQYKMTKAARIRRLGDSLQQIDEALSEADLSQVAPEKLLKLKLEYAQALREEYPSTALALEGGDSDSILQAYIGLLLRVQAGTATEAQAKAEMALIERIKSAQQQVDNEEFWEEVHAQRNTAEEYAGEDSGE